MGTDDRLEALLVQLSTQMQAQQEQLTQLRGEITDLDKRVAWGHGATAREMQRQQDDIQALGGESSSRVEDSASGPSPAAEQQQDVAERLDHLRETYNRVMRGHPDRATRAITILHQHEAISLYDLRPDAYAAVQAALEGLEE